MLRRLWSEWIFPILLAVALAVLLRIFVLELRLNPQRIHGADAADR